MLSFNVHHFFGGGLLEYIYTLQCSLIFLILYISIHPLSETLS